MKFQHMLLILCFVSFNASGENTLCFIENVGQFTDQFHQPRTDIDFGMRTRGINIFVEAGSVHYQFMKAETKPIPATSFDPLYGMIDAPGFLNMHRMDVELLGANKNVQPVTEGRLPYYERYYTPQFGEQGGIAHAYSRIVYKDIYPHIDWVLYVNGEQIEYDFVVREGGNPADIRLQYNGVNSLHIDANGHLVAQTLPGSITEHAPSSWQEDGNSVPTTFNIQDNIVSFNIAPYNGTLLIDPYIEWATFYGGASMEGGTLVAEDASGNVYISSYTLSATNIASSGAYDVTYADKGDVYLAKFNSAGALLWATYFGGYEEDYGGGVAYDNHGCVYISGATNSPTGIATSGSHQPVFSGPSLPVTSDLIGDGFLAKFDSNGARIWGTYIGGTDREKTGGIICDLAGNVYVSGATFSTTSIATGGSHQPNKASNDNDGFLVKYNPAGQKLWGTYYGGDLRDYCHRLCLSQNNIIMCGFTESSNNIATPGTYQTSLPSSFSGFIVKFDTNGSRIWGTYFGGSTPSAYTILSSVSSNVSGDIFAIGTTGDQNGMTTSGCHQASFGGGTNPFGGDMVIAKFDSSGNRIWSTYLGGSGEEFAGGIECNQLGELYVTGATASPNNIAFNALQGNYMGGSQNGTDGIVAKFSEAGVCIWSTYWGGSGDDHIAAQKVSNNSSLYIAGVGSSFPTTSGSHQPNFAGGMNDTYLVKFKDFPTGIAIANNKKSSINISPNPNDGVFILECMLPDNSDNEITINIYDISGRNIYSDKFKRSELHFSKQIVLGENLPGGLYTLQVTSGNYSAVERILKK